MHIPPIRLERDFRVQIDDRSAIPERQDSCQEVQEFLRLGRYFDILKLNLSVCSDVDCGLECRDTICRTSSNSSTLRISTSISSSRKLKTTSTTVKALNTTPIHSSTAPTGAQKPLDHVSLPPWAHRGKLADTSPKT